MNASAGALARPFKALFVPNIFIRPFTAEIKHFITDTTLFRPDLRKLGSDGLNLRDERQTQRLKAHASGLEERYRVSIQTCALWLSLEL
jgi:hypothetical protein